MIRISNDMQLSIAYVSWINEQLREEKQRREEKQTRRRPWLWRAVRTELASAIVSITVMALWFLDR